MMNISVRDINRDVYIFLNVERDWFGIRYKELIFFGGWLFELTRRLVC